MGHTFYKNSVDQANKQKNTNNKTKKKDFKYRNKMLNSYRLDTI